MQCKDIPDEPILKFLAARKGEWATWFTWMENSVSQAMPEGTPEKLILAKMRTLIRRGLVEGCACGCRGDFVITEKGLKALGVDGE